VNRYWTGRRVLVTGGASFIGSHLVDALIARGAEVRVVDDLSSGTLENLQQPLARPSIEFIEADLREPGVARTALTGQDVVFHLASDHGGRGYVDLHQGGPSSNLYLDGLVFWEALQADVEKVVYASSGCVYPNYLQSDPDIELFLTEEMVKPPYDADNMYGWSKLMGELALQAYNREFGLNAASCRYFTAYGPRAKENHAVMAMIARAFIGQDPFEVWGTGQQVRNWTYVDDIVSGTILAAEKIDDATAVNLGTSDPIRVQDAVKMIMEMTGHQADIVNRSEMPTGPMNRVADNTLARHLIGWEPLVPFSEGLTRTIEWYYSTKDRAQVRRVLEGDGLIKRKVEG
jgi:nucleoside-diphosphate-sugar epimerase